MADIELVIRINKEVVEAFDKAKKENTLNYYMNVYKDDLYNAIKNGTPLPKKHGRLIDADDLLDRIELEDNNSNRENNVGEIITLEDFDSIPTIIEADKAESEVKNGTDN